MAATGQSSTEVQVNPVPETRAQLLKAHEAFWAINLRHHRGDPEFREQVHQLRDSAAALLEALDASAPQ